MVSDRILVDTGPLVAIARESDQHHTRCVEQAGLFLRAMLTCWPVLTEAAWLLDDFRPVTRMLRSGKLVCLELDQNAAASIDTYAAKYADLNPQLADLAIVYLAERERIRHIFTLDRRDFAVYKTASGKSFHLLPESL